MTGFPGDRLGNRLERKGLWPKSQAPGGSEGGSHLFLKCTLSPPTFRGSWTTYGGWNVEGLPQSPSASL